MERAAHDAARVRDDPLGQGTRALDHLARRAPREREQQDPLRWDALPSSQATRAHSVVVLPVPAPARINSGPPACVAAARCSALSSSQPGACVAVVEHLFGDARAPVGWGASARAHRSPAAMLGGVKARDRYQSQLDGLRALGVLVAIMWVVELVNVLDSYRLDGDGILPRNVSHVYGIAFAPFLHTSFSHLLGNTIPFVILGLAVALAGARRLLLVSLIVALVSGLGTWLTAPAGSVTVGASGVVFGYAAYLISRGLFDRRAVEIGLGVLVAVLFGGALISDLVPHGGISWQAHLFGGIGGVIAAAALAPPSSAA